MRIAKEAREIVLAEHGDADEETQWRLAEMESIKVSIRNLHSFPFVKEAIETRQLNVIGVYFDLERGQLWELDESTKQFRQLQI
jgi:carbonic anhydrase